jgi:hypothetical protein
VGAEAGLRQRVRDAVREHYPEVKLYGWPASALQGSGRPDLFGCAWSHFFALELKARTGRATMIQQANLRAIRRAGGYAWIARTVPQALQAIAWIKQRRHPPMAEEPLDISTWFADLEDPAPEPAPAAAEALPEFEVLNFPEPSLPDPSAGIRTGEPTPPPSGEDRIDLILDQLAKLDADIRAVGDRVTMSIEEATNLRLEVFTSRRVVQEALSQVNKLIALVSDEEQEEPPNGAQEAPPAPEPPKRRRRSAASGS